MPNQDHAGLGRVVPLGAADRPSLHGGRSALVVGATGFIGRWLVKELADRSVRTTAAVRSAASGRRLLGWLEDHGATTHLVDTVAVDLTTDGLGLGPADALRLRGVREVYNVAGPTRSG